MPTTHRHHIDGPGLELWISRGAVTPAETTELMTALVSEVPWRQDKITIFGATHPVPRLTSWHGDPGAQYAYSGIEMNPQPWSRTLERAHSVVVHATGLSFNSVLLNWYRDGSDSMGWHSDDEPELGTKPVIASLSLGATRSFQLRRRDDHAEKRKELVHDGDLLVMSGDTQTLWAHQIPKTKRLVGERMNLTFRTVQT